MYRIEISDSEKYIDTFRYQQKIKRYDIISIYRPTLPEACPHVITLVAKATFRPPTVDNSYLKSTTLIGYTIHSPSYTFKYADLVASSFAATTQDRLTAVVTSLFSIKGTVDSSSSFI